MKNNLSDRSFVVIGANSYIARHIVFFLKQYGSTVYLYDKDNVSADNLQPYFSINISDINSVRTIRCDVDFIMVFSGLTGTSIGFDLYDSFIEVNEKGLLNVLTSVKEKKSKGRIIFPSSRLIYKGKKNQPLKEDDEKDFKTIYALNKFSCENYLKIYNECFDIPYTIFRICIPFGNVLDDALSYGTLGHFISAASQGNTITIFGNGKQKRSFIHIQDVCEIILCALNFEESKNNIFNVGGPDVITIEHVAQSIALQYGVRVHYKKWPLIMEKIESGDTIFDSSKIEKLTSYAYKYNFEKWLKEIKK